MKFAGCHTWTCLQLKAGGESLAWPRRCPRSWKIANLIPSNQSLTFKSSVPQFLFFLFLTNAFRCYMFLLTAFIKLKNGHYHPALCPRIVLTSLTQIFSSAPPKWQRLLVGTAGPMLFKELWISEVALTLRGWRGFPIFSSSFCNAEVLLLPSSL